MNSKQPGGRNRPRVLLVEDDHNLARSLQWHLQADGYQVDVAYDGVEALDKAFTWQPDVIVLDYLLPEANGGTLVRALEHASLRGKVRILLLTGMLDAIELAHHLCVDRWLDKPADPDQVSRVIRQMLTSRPADRLYPHASDIPATRHSGHAASFEIDRM